MRSGRAARERSSDGTFRCRTLSRGMKRGGNNLHPTAANAVGGRPTCSTFVPHASAKEPESARTSDKRKASLTWAFVVSTRDPYPHHPYSHGRGHWFEPSTAHQRDRWNRPWS